MIVLYVILGIIAFVFALAILYIAFLAVCALLVNPKKEYPSHSKFYRALINITTAIAILLLRIEVVLEGEDLLPAEGQYLFVCNHISNFDPIITWHVLKDNISFLTKEENLHIIFFGRFIRKCCFLAIDRVDPKKALKAILKAGDTMKREHINFGVYPEGTRNKSAKGLLPFHSGVFKAAERANAALVVAVVKGSNNIAKNYPWKKTKVTLTILETIPALEVKELKAKGLCARAREKMEAAVLR